MDQKKMYQLLEKMSVTRISGSKEELDCATWLKGEVEQMGGEASIIPFQVSQTEFQKVSLSTCNGQQYEVTGYRCSLDTKTVGLEAPFYYMDSIHPIHYIYAKGKIVLVNGYLRKPTYEALIKAGAVGFITYDGDVYDEQADIDVRELREPFFELGKLPGVHMRTIDAMHLVEENPKMVRLTLLKEEKMVDSHNVISEIKGSIYADEVIVYTAHYDSVLFSKGAYDNGAGSVILLGLYDYFMHHKPTRTMRFVWCGSEERGLLGSKYYVSQLSKENLETIVLNVNVDVAGAILGKDSSVVLGNEALMHMITYLAKEVGFPIDVTQDIYSSDCIPFADQGIPSVNFMRFGVGNSAHIHSRYDTMHFIGENALYHTYSFIEIFSERLQHYRVFPIDREIPEKIKDKVDKYLFKKTEQTK